MNVSLRDWRKNGWLTEHEATRDEIVDLLSLMDRDLSDCQSPGLSADWRLGIAYNAALQAAVAALAAEGYRVAREAHHFRAIQSLALTLGCDDRLVAQLEAFRKKRNISDYERAGSVSVREAQEMFDLAARLRDELVQWLRRVHGEFLSEDP
jgi:hypothetical protein